MNNIAYVVATRQNNYSKYLRLILLLYKRRYWKRDITLAIFQTDLLCVIKDELCHVIFIIHLQKYGI